MRINENWVQTLTLLKMQHNLFTGALPSMLFQLNNLATLQIGGNQFAGTMTDLGSMTRLETLVLNESIQGTIGTSIGSLLALRELELRDAFIVGTIPTELGKCNLLQRLGLVNTAISGTIPTELGALTLLRK